MAMAVAVAMAMAIQAGDDLSRRATHESHSRENRAPESGQKRDLLYSNWIVGTGSLGEY
jgi:hypothetical protein